MENKNIENEEQVIEEGIKINGENQKQPHKKNIKIFLIFLASSSLLVGFVVLAMFVIYPDFEVGDEISFNENNEVGNVSGGDLQQPLEETFFDRASKACGQDVSWRRNLESGEMIAFLRDDMTSGDIKKYLKENKLEILTEDTMGSPTEVTIEWKDEFLESNIITIDEINAFYKEILKDESVESVRAYYTHKWPGNTGNNYRSYIDYEVDIDRWGYFVIRFSDPGKMSEFWQKYPQATKYDVIEVDESGSKVEESIGMEATVMYKANGTLNVINKIKKDLGMGNEIAYENVFGKGVKPSVELDDLVNTNYTVFLLRLPGDLTSSEIREILGNYEELDLEKIVIDGRVSTLLLKVPKYYERCWADEFEKEPEVRSAMPNIHLPPPSWN